MAFPDPQLELSQAIRFTFSETTESLAEHACQLDLPSINPEKPQIASSMKPRLCYARTQKP